MVNGLFSPLWILVVQAIVLTLSPPVFTACSDSFGDCLKSKRSSASQKCLFEDACSARECTKRRELKQTVVWYQITQWEKNSPRMFVISGHRMMSERQGKSYLTIFLMWTASETGIDKCPTVCLCSWGPFFVSFFPFYTYQCSSAYQISNRNKTVV